MTTNCDHNLKLLIGTAEGFKCRGCGAVFPTLPTTPIIVKSVPKGEEKKVTEEVKEEEVKEEAKKSEPKKTTRKKSTTTKGGKK